MLDATLQHDPVLFPGTAIRRNIPLTEAVRAVQARLCERGCGPLAVDGVFGARTEAAVRLFQSRFFDRSGAPLVADGRVHA